MTTPQPVDRQAWARLVVAALDAMPADQARVIELLYFEQLPEAQAAARAGIALTRARTAAAEALRNLSAELHKAYLKSARSAALSPATNESAVGLVDTAYKNRRAQLPDQESSQGHRSKTQ